MRIVLITQDAPIYLHEFLFRFFRRLQTTHHQIVGVVVESSLTKPFFSEVFYRLRLYGPWDFLRTGLMILGNKLWSTLYALGLSKRCASVGNVIREFALPRVKTAGVNSPAFLEFVRSNDVDLVVSVASPVLFKKELLQTPKRGCINYHSALLPRYRGIQPLFWALLNGEPEVGVTVHEMDRKLDNGPILVQQRIPVEAGDTLHSLYWKTFAVGPAALLAALDLLEAGEEKRLPNAAENATYFGHPQPEDTRNLKRQGKRLY
ncbi:MAG TPA: formyltransferase family protein [bacterium]|nr:formyltransferase family protein [bacterium]